MQAAMHALDLLVVIDPYPSATAAMAAMPLDEQGMKVLKDAGKQAKADRAVYLLPAATQRETSGLVTASNRSVQWREEVIESMVDAKTDQTSMPLFART